MGASALISLIDQGPNRISDAHPRRYPKLHGSNSGSTTGSITRSASDTPASVRAATLSNARTSGRSSPSADSRVRVSAHALEEGLLARATRQQHAHGQPTGSTATAP